MATIDELDRLDQEINEAEVRALHNLADHLRQAVLDIPAASPLARSFMRHADEFDRWADGRSGMLELRKLARELCGDVLSEVSEVLDAAVACIPLDNCHRGPLVTMADVLRGIDAS